MLLPFPVEGFSGQSMIYDEGFLLRLESALRAAMPKWGIPGDAKLSLLTISENATFAAGEGDAMRVIRVHRPDYHSEAEILSELAWIEALRREGIVATPRPIAGTDGSLLQRFADGATERHAVAFEYMPGKAPDETSDLTRWYGHLGAITARLHAHSRGWTRPEGFARKIWSFDTIIGDGAHWGDWRAAEGLDAPARALLERTHALLARQTEAYGSGPDRFGLVHCDMRAANLLVEGDRLGVIDFDDCGISWFAYDFAAAVSFIEEAPELPALMRAWIAGYRGAAPLDEAHVAALPMFVMLRRMQLTAWLASHAETPTAQELGAGYTQGTVRLARAYLARHGEDAGA